ncbi:glyoxylate/hydroxypyruvate reductase A, partial [Burkholderia pseudomallei]
MRILLYTPHRDAHDWKRDVERALPGAQLRTWTPGDDAGADYALVWRAPREFFAPRAGLKAVFNLGAGVDA